MSNVVGALTAELHDSVNLMALGPHRLRGVGELVEMYELHVVGGSVFPSSAVTTSPLIALHDADNASAAGGAAADENPLMDSDGASSHAPSNVGRMAEALDVNSSAYSDRRKIKPLQRTCKYFSLSKPQRKMLSSDSVHLSTLIESVTTRTSAVIDFKQ
jgi:adenylate cyclase